MLLRDYGYPADFSDGRSTRDTTDGFALIAAGLEEGGVDVIQGNSKIGDALAICLGWLMLAAVIFYPTVQLVAVGVCIALMCMRPFVQHAFGVGKRLG
jgi:hypothetical protein